MNRLTIPTRGIGSWRDRLCDPDKQWKRGYSAFEMAVSWERASNRVSGLPTEIEQWFLVNRFADPRLIIATAEHQVALAGRGGDSQCDVWGIVNTNLGWVSVAIEGKAQEPFGNGSLDEWLQAGKSPRSPANRQRRWQNISDHLPKSSAYPQVQYQLLHRCAVSVIESRRLGITHAVCIIQSFANCAQNVAAYELLCKAVDPSWARGKVVTATVGPVALTVGWVDCPLATDAQVAACM